MQRVVGTKEHSSPGGCVPALELSREEKGSRSQNVCYWPWLVRVPSSNHSSRPFLARGRCNRTLRHFCQKCIVHSVCNLRPSPSRHRHHIASYRIASPASRSKFYGSSRPSKNTSLCNNEIITFVTFVWIYGVSRRSPAFSRPRKPALPKQRRHVLMSRHWFLELSMYGMVISLLITHSLHCIIF